MGKHIPIVLPPFKLDAILHQQATQLRVPLSPQPAPHLTAFYPPSTYRKGFEFYDDNHWAGAEIRKYPEVHCPYGKPHDLLYVQQEWSTIGERSQDFILKSKTVAGSFTDRNRKPWQPPETMPKVLAQYWLKVTSVNVERVQSISKAAARAEGPTPFPEGNLKGFAPAFIDRFTKGDVYPGGSPEDPTYVLGTRPAFQQWWRAVHGPDAWTANDWVWVVSFQLITPL
ncbi:hypothetical protein [Spirosoma arcticum]